MSRSTELINQDFDYVHSNIIREHKEIGRRSVTTVMMPESYVFASDERIHHYLSLAYLFNEETKELEITEDVIDIQKIGSLQTASMYTGDGPGYCI